MEVVSKEDIFKNSDIVTLHTSLNKETENLINKKTLDLMKPSSYIINTSRGEVINEGDLIEALENKKISGVALDVYREEPPKNKRLIGRSNVICTPHIGGNSEESVLVMGFSAIDNLKNFLEDGFKKRT